MVNGVTGRRAGGGLRPLRPPTFPSRPGRVHDQWNRREREWRGSGRATVDQAIRTVPNSDTSFVRRLGTQLTDQRASALERARTTNCADRLENLGRRPGRGEECGLRIGYVPDAMHTGILPRALRAVHGERPGVDIALYNLPPTEQFEGLRQRSLGIALVHEPPGADDPDLLAARLLEDPLLLALPAGHPLADQEEVTPGDLDGRPWIAVENPQNPAVGHVRRRLHGVRLHAGHPPRRRRAADCARPGRLRTRSRPRAEEHDPRHGRGRRGT